VGVKAGPVGLPYQAHGRRRIGMGEMAVPGAYGRALRNRPLGCLSAGNAAHAPDILFPPIQAYGFQVCVFPAASKAGLDEGGVESLHSRGVSKNASNHNKGVGQGGFVHASFDIHPFFGKMPPPTGLKKYC